MGLVGRTHISGREVWGGRPAESGSVRRGCRVTLGRLWNIPVTTADTRVGDADVSRRSEGGVTTTLWSGDTGPFWVDVSTDVRVLSGEPVGVVLGGFK